MTGLAVYWDIHEQFSELIGGAKRWLSAYLFTAEAFGIDQVFVIGKPGIIHGYNIQHKEYEDIDAFLQAHPKERIVACVGKAPEGIEPLPLKGYKHPKDNVIYMVGGDYGDIEYDKLQDREVKYVTIENRAGIGHLWSHVVAGIVLRDRYIKWQ